MAIRIGPFDPLQLIFKVMDNLMRKGLISAEEAKDIIRQSLPPDNEMPSEEKEKLINSMVRKVESPQSLSPQSKTEQ